MHVCAITMLGEHFPQWKAFVPEVLPTLRVLFDLSLRGREESHPTSPTHGSGSPTDSAGAASWHGIDVMPAVQVPLPPPDPELIKAAGAALVEVGQCSPNEFLDLMDEVLGQV